MYIGSGFDTDGDGSNDVYVFGRSRARMHPITTLGILAAMVGVPTLFLGSQLVQTYQLRQCSIGKLTAAEAKKLVEATRDALPSWSPCSGVVHLDHLSLDKITSISPEAASVLATYDGGLMLGGLVKLAPNVAEKLVGAPNYISLPALQSLSRDTASALARHRGTLYLNGLTTLSDEAANALAQHEGALSLNGLTTLSDKAAKALSRRKGSLCGLDLNGLTTLSDEAAAALGQYEAGILELEGLTVLSDEAAKSLRANRNVSLPAQFKRKR